MSKGRKKPSLQNLSREPLSPKDYAALHNELITGTDRSAAILGCTMVETAVLQAVAANFLTSEDEFEDLFFKPTAPLSNFSARIKVGRALGIYGGQFSGMLDSIRRIRNVFAHSVRPLLFTHELIEKELNELPPAVLSEKKMKRMGLDLTNLSPHRDRYLAVCLGIAIILEDYVNRHAGKPIKIDIPDGPPRKREPLPRKSTEHHPPGDQSPD